MEKSISLPSATELGLTPGGVWALGNFDGVHLGHAAVVKAALGAAHKLDSAAHVLTFEPHPYAVFGKEKANFRLTSSASKKRLLGALGVSDIIDLPFTLELAQMTPEAFVEHVLIRLCQPQHVVVGFDFAFGQGRAGDRALLRGELAPHRVGVTEVPPLLDKKGEAVSSSRIRALLASGDLDEAAALLGRSYAIEGLVVHGDGRGRTLSFPTANVNMGGALRPPRGVYAVMAKRVGERRALPGVANVGTRPTVGGQGDSLEFHLFDFDGDLYGQTWEVSFKTFLRPERRFADLETLSAQIQKDAARARTILA